MIVLLAFFKPILTSQNISSTNKRKASIKPNQHLMEYNRILQNLEVKIEREKEDLLFSNRQHVLNLYISQVKVILVQFKTLILEFKRLLLENYHNEFRNLFNWCVSEGTMESNINLIRHRLKRFEYEINSYLFYTIQEYSRVRHLETEKKVLWKSLDDGILQKISRLPKFEEENLRFERRREEQFRDLSYHSEECKKLYEEIIHLVRYFLGEYYKIFN